MPYIQSGYLDNGNDDPYAGIDEAYRRGYDRSRNRRREDMHDRLALSQAVRGYGHDVMAAEEHQFKMNALQRQQEQAAADQKLMGEMMAATMGVPGPQALENLHKLSPSFGKMSPQMQLRAASQLQQIGMQQQAAQKRQAFDEYLKSGMEDGMLDQRRAMALQQQADAGGDLDSMIGALEKERNQKALDESIRQHNEEELQRQMQIYAAMRPGQDKILMGAAIRSYASSSKAMSDPDTAGRMQQDVAKIFAGDNYKKNQAAVDEQQANVPAPGLPGMTVGQRNKEMSSEPFMGMGGPDIPAFQAQGPQAHATVKRQGTGTTEQLTRALYQLSKSAKSSEDLAKKLSEQGVPLTTGLLDFVDEIWKNREGEGVRNGKPE